MGSRYKVTLRQTMPQIKTCKRQNTKLIHSFLENGRLLSLYASPSEKIVRPRGVFYTKYPYGSSYGDGDGTVCVENELGTD